MKNTILRIFFPLFLLFANYSPAQQINPVKEKIADAIVQYFDLDRESIHAHFDKTLFFTNEEIWFKGYVFNKKNGTPFFETTNVFAVLFDDSGRQISEQLLFSYIGTFSGTFKLDSALKSGRYHIQFYTNWMNNFPEDESSAYTVQVINEADTFMADYNAPDYSKINIAFQPEGGNFIQDAINNLGIRISDCNENPIEATEGRIVNSKGEVVSNFVVGKSGYAKAYMVPGAETYKAIFSINGKETEALLPKAAMTGVALEVNNYALPGKTIIKLRTNARTLPSLSKKPLFIVVQQNNKSTIFETGFTDQNTEKELVIENSNLFKGINSVRIIDPDMQQLAERITFEPAEEHPEFSFSYTRLGNGDIKIYGKSNYPNADISISVLPENSVALSKKSDICGSLMINPYLSDTANRASYYLHETSKTKKFEFDLFLLNQKSGKYNWADIVAGPTKSTYDFDVGLTVKGTINQSLPDPKKYRIRLFSPFSLIDDYSEINNKNEFVFKNLVFGDLANFKFTLMEIPSIPVEMNFYHQVLNRKRPFNKPFKANPAACLPGAQIPLDMPQFGKDVVQLQNVDVVAKAKTELKYKDKFGNANLHGYKITDQYIGTSLLSFIGENGFNVSQSFGDVSVTGRLKTTINGQANTPEIYINGRQLMSFDELQDINMGDVDEIYLNPHAIVASIKNNMGVIKIYMKKMDFGNGKNQSKSFEIKEGFAALRNFENANYLSTSDSAFQKYGVMQWVPTILTDEDGAFSFNIPKTTLKTATLNIEGFTPDGKIISETKTISIE